MYLLHLSSLLILTFSIILPASFSAPTAPPTGDATMECDRHYPIPGQPTWYHNAPFPSDCRFLANHMTLLPDSHILMPFDERYPASGAAGRSVIPTPYSLRYQTCVATFSPQPPAPGTPDPNLARYAGFANMVGFAVKTCFDVLPGKESEDDVVAFGTFKGWDGNGWEAVLTGPVVRPNSSRGNATVLDGGLSSSFNGSLTRAGGGDIGTSATESVDVT